MVNQSVRQPWQKAWPQGSLVEGQSRRAGKGQGALT
jgi:hypothetical protein